MSELDISLNHVNRLSLPEGAVERGVPSDPSKMAALLKAYCKQEKLYARRTAVLLPDDAVFTKLVDLPVNLTSEEARDYISNPRSGLQIPIPLLQTDFDISPTTIPACLTDCGETKPYFLTSTPEKLIDQIIETLDAADLELIAVDFSFACQLRLLSADIAALNPGEYLLHLELLPDCSFLTIAGGSGPLLIERLSSIREFNEPELSQDQVAAALSESLFGEQITLGSDDYLPISDLDLRVLIDEIKQAMLSFSSRSPSVSWKGLALSGINSAHPSLGELLHSAFHLNVYTVRPLGATGIGKVSFNTIFVSQQLGSLFGLGLRFLSHDTLLSCSLDERNAYYNFVNQSLHVNEFVDVEARDELINDSLNDLEPDAGLAPLSSKLLAEPLGYPSSLPEEKVEEWPSLRLGDSAEEERKEEGKEEGKEEEWPSLKLGDSVVEERKEEEMEEEWPSLKLGDSAEEERKEEGKEEEWPSLRLGDSAEEERKEEGKEEEWPSLKLGDSAEEERKEEGKEE